MTNAYVPDEDPEESKLSLSCGQSQSTGSFLQLNPTNEFSSFAGDVTLIFSGPAERDDWLNSISRLRNSTMARVMRARKDSQAALTAQDDIALASANHALRKPPFIVKRNLVKAMEWRDSSTADMLMTYKTSRLKRSGVAHVPIGAAAQAPPLPGPAKVAVDSGAPQKRTKSFGMAAFNTMQSAFSKARRGSSSKKVVRAPLSALRPRLDSAGSVLDTCSLLLPTATESLSPTQQSCDPYVICTYRNTGSLCLTSTEAATATILKNDSKILVHRFRQPYVISLHEDMKLQVYNLTTDKTESFSALQGLPDSITATPNFRPRAASLLSDYNRVAVVLTMGGVYKVVLFRFSGSDSSATVQLPALQHEATLTLFMPMDTLARAAYALVPTHKFCKLDGENLLLACYDQWQVWSLLTAELVHFDTNNLDGAITTFSDVRWEGDFLAAASSDDIYVWSLEQRQRLYSIRTGFIVSSMSLDDKGVLVGGTEGQVFVRSHFVKEQRIVLSADVVKPPESASPAFKGGFDNKMNDLCRIRWRNVEFVVAVSEVSGIYMWHPESATLIKHWKSRGHHAISCAHLPEAVRVLVRRKAARVAGSDAGDRARSDSPGTASFEIWQISLKFLDKWLSEHMDVLEQTPSSARGPLLTFAASETSSSFAVGTVSNDDSELGPSGGKSMATLPLGIPNTLGTRFFPWVRTLLLRSGVLVTMYKGVGSVMLRSDSTSVVIENPNPIVAWTKREHLFMTLHRDGTLQAIDITKNAVVATFLARAMVRTKDSIAAAPGIDAADGPDDNDDTSSSETSAPDSSTVPFSDENLMERTVTPQDEKEQSAIVLADPDSQNVAIVRAYETRYVVWELQLIASTIVTSVRKLACVPPALPDGSVVAMLKLEPSICSYWSGHLILGSRQELQIWSLENGSLSKRLAAPVRHFPVCPASLSALTLFCAPEPGTSDKCPANIRLRYYNRPLGVRDNWRLHPSNSTPWPYRRWPGS